MNLVTLSGRLVREPDIRYTQGDNAMCVAKFTLAVDRRFKKDGEPTADFINCVCFGKTAEVIERHCTKGTKLIVSGEWRTGSYTNKDGQKVYTNDCNVTVVEFAESKASASQNQQNTQAQNNGFDSIPQMVDESDCLPFDI